MLSCACTETETESRKPIMKKFYKNVFFDPT